MFHSKATTWNSDIKCWKLPRYDRSNYNIINDGSASNNKDNEIACIKGNIIHTRFRQKKTRNEMD